MPLGVDGLGPLSDLNYGLCPSLLVPVPRDGCRTRVWEKIQPLTHHVLPSEVKYQEGNAR